MRWKNVRIFGLKELMPSPLALTVISLVMAIIILFLIWTKYDNPVDIPAEIQEVFHEEIPAQEQEENNTPVVNEEEADAKFYSVNTYFFSSDCVFRYNSLIDDLEDLKSQRLRIREEFQAAQSSSVQEKLQQIEVYLANI